MSRREVQRGFWTRGRKIIGGVLGVLVALVIIGAIVGPPPPEQPTAALPRTTEPAPPPAPVQPATPATTAPSVEPAPAPAPAPVQARPTDDQRADFLQRVQVIAPPLAEFPARVIGRGENTCPSLTNTDAETGEPWSEDRIVDQAIERFSGGSYTVTRDQAAQLVDAARETVCATA